MRCNAAKINWTPIILTAFPSKFFQRSSGAARDGERLMGATNFVMVWWEQLALVFMTQYLCISPFELVTLPWVTGRLTDWPVGWLAGWLESRIFGWLDSQLAGWLSDRLADELAGLLAVCLAGWVASWLAVCLIGLAGWLTGCVSGGWLAGLLVGWLVY